MILAGRVVLVHTDRRPLEARCQRFDGRLIGVLKQLDGAEELVRCEAIEQDVDDFLDRWLGAPQIEPVGLA